MLAGASLRGTTRNPRFTKNASAVVVSNHQRCTPQPAAAFSKFFRSASPSPSPRNPGATTSERSNASGPSTCAPIAPISSPARRATRKCARCGAKSSCGKSASRNNPAIADTSSVTAGMTAQLPTNFSGAALSIPSLVSFTPETLHAKLPHSRQNIRSALQTSTEFAGNCYPFRSTAVMADARFSISFELRRQSSALRAEKIPATPATTSAALTAR